MINSTSSTAWNFSRLY